MKLSKSAIPSINYSTSFRDYRYFQFNPGKNISFNFLFIHIWFHIKLVNHSRTLKICFWFEGIFFNSCCKTSTAYFIKQLSKKTKRNFTNFFNDDVSLKMKILRLKSFQWKARARQTMMLSSSIDWFCTYLKMMRIEKVIWQILV